VAGDKNSWRSTAAGLSWVWWGTFLLVFVSVTTVTLLVAAIVLQASDAMYAAENLGSIDLTGTPDVASEEDESNSFQSQFAHMKRGDYAKAVAVLAVLGFVGSLVLAGVLLRVLGFVRAAAVPGESGAKPMAILTLLCEVGYWGSYGAGIYLNYTAPEFSLFAALGQLGALLLGLVFVLVLCHQIGNALSSKAMGGRIISFTIWFFVWIGLTVGTFFGIPLAIALLLSGDITETKVWIARSIRLTVLLIWLLLPTIVLVKYLGILSSTSDEIRRRALRGVR